MHAWTSRPTSAPRWAEGPPAAPRRWLQRQGRRCARPARARCPACSGCTETPMRDQRLEHRSARATLPPGEHRPGRPRRRAGSAPAASNARTFSTSSIASISGVCPATVGVPDPRRAPAASARRARCRGPPRCGSATSRPARHATRAVTSGAPPPAARARISRRGPAAAVPADPDPASTRPPADRPASARPARSRPDRLDLLRRQRALFGIASSSRPRS